MVVRLPPRIEHHRFTVDEYHRMIDLGIMTKNHPVELIEGEIAYKADYRSPEFHYTPTVERYRFTVDEYERLVAAGILAADDRVELIHGEVVKKMAIGPRHAATVKRLRRLFGERAGNRVTLGSQDPIRLQDSEPEPDLSVLHFSPDEYARRHPTPAEIFLLVEVADSSLDDDRNIKGPLYARNNVPEYWIVDLITDTVHVHRGPRPDGTWAAVTAHARGATLTVAALPGVGVAVAELLP
jgi:Uma2 family endonuclease